MNHFLELHDAHVIAVEATIAIATVSEKGLLVSTDELAAKLHLSRKYLAKALNSLSAANIIKSTRGPGGGYRIAAHLAPENITLWDVYSAITPSVPPANLTGSLTNLANNINSSIKKHLQSLTVRDGM